ncbi:transcription factor RFX4 [Trichonephila clavipes]|nr:transcription factor RFX4 [Trichonephila clavipes]
MSFPRRSGSGHPRQTGRREDRHIVRNACVQPTGSSAAIQVQVAPSLGVPVFSRTIRRCLAEEHLESRSPLRVLPLTSPFGVMPRRRKLDCAVEWNPVVFSDESTFNLSSDDNRVRVWRPRGERLNLASALQRHTTLTADVMVWGAIAYNTRSLLVLIRGTMTAKWYVHDILQPNVLPFMQQLPGALFQQNNAQPHTARVSQDCLRTVTILPWPARSPDVSPVEYIWGHLERRATGRRKGGGRRLARQFLLLWSAFGTRVIRDMTLHSAASFGSFHLLRLMFDDYVLFLVETIHTEDQMKDFMRNLMSDMPPQITAFSDGDRFNSCQVIYSQFGLAIHQNDHQARRRFVEWAQNEIAVVPDFHKRILFSDEAHFWLNGYVNKQNCRIWSEANPQVYVETPLYPEKLTVWCVLWAGGILLQKR